MALEISAAVRNARLDAIETTIGTSALLRLYSGAPPADLATAPSGTLLATLTLPSDWLAAAASGAKAKAGTWSGTGAAAGAAGYFRVLIKLGRHGASAGHRDRDRRRRGSGAGQREHRREPGDHDQYVHPDRRQQRHLRRH